MQDTTMVRNVALIGHGNSGKTSLVEAMLYTAGKINRLGSVDDGNTCMDYEDKEIARNISISSSFGSYKWKKHEVFFVDTPGDDSFFNETVFASHVSDSAILTVGAVLGVKGQTRKFADLIADNSTPSVIVITKMDRERSNFTQTVDQIRDKLPLNPVLIQVPIGAEENFKGVIDLISGKALLFDADKGSLTETEIPADMTDEVESYRESLMESIAETDEELIEKFLEEEKLTEEEMMAGLKKAIREGEVSPVCICSPSMLYTLRDM